MIDQNNKINEIYCQMADDFISNIKEKKNQQEGNRLEISQLKKIFLETMSKHNQQLKHFYMDKCPLEMSFNAPCKSLADKFINAMNIQFECKCEKSHDYIESFLKETSICDLGIVFMRLCLSRKTDMLDQWLDWAQKNIGSSLDSILPHMLRQKLYMMFNLYFGQDISDEEREGIIEGIRWFLHHPIYGSSNSLYDFDLGEKVKIVLRLTELDQPNKSKTQSTQSTPVDPSIQHPSKQPNLVQKLLDQMEPEETDKLPCLKLLASAYNTCG